MTTEATPAAAEPQQSTALTVQERAVRAMGSTAATVQRLTELAKQSAGIVKITNDDGYKEADSARKALKRERLAIEKLGKGAREDAQAFAKAVIAEEKRLVAIVETEEARLEGLLKAEDERKEAIARKAREAEQARIADIQKRIAWISGRALELVGKPTAEIAKAIADLEGLPITDELYGEFADQARAAHGVVLDKLRTMHAAAVKAEADAKALAEARVELERKQAELDAADRERKERIEREDAARKEAQRIEDEARAKKFREIEEAQRYAADWDEAHREDAERTARREREAAEAAERERRRQEREALEAKADPWGALQWIATAAEVPDPLKVPASKLLGKLEDIANRATECLAARDRLAEIDA